MMLQNLFQRMENYNAQNVSVILHMVGEEMKVTISFSEDGKIELIEVTTEDENGNKS